MFNLYLSAPHCEALLVFYLTFILVVLQLQFFIPACHITKTSISRNIRSRVHADAFDNQS